MYSLIDFGIFHFSTMLQKTECNLQEKINRNTEILKNAKMAKLEIIKNIYAKKGEKQFSKRACKKAEMQQ